MIKKLISVSGHQYTVEYPDKCPICHHFGTISIVTAHATIKKGVEVIFQCPFDGCQQYFIGYYGMIPSNQLLALKPQKPELSMLPEVISQLSPQFVSIFKEAEEARQIGLSQIAGPGYRKAFEFLIKDYAKSKTPEKAVQIEEAFSGKVVNDYISDTRIQGVAKRALWLGNDETHYLKKWIAHDINDLINLIKLTINWIEIEHLSDNYRKEMPE